MAPRVRGALCHMTQTGICGPAAVWAPPVHNTVLEGISALVSSTGKLCISIRGNALPVTLRSIYHSYYRPQLPVALRPQFVCNFRVQTSHRTKFAVYTSLNASCGGRYLGDIIALWSACNSSVGRLRVIGYGLKTDRDGNILYANTSRLAPGAY
jgi:hypothetical protein